MWEEHENENLMLSIMLSIVLYANSGIYGISWGLSGDDTARQNLFCMRQIQKEILK